MNHSNEEGVRLEFSDGRQAITNLAEVNEALEHISYACITCGGVIRQTIGGCL